MNTQQDGKRCEMGTLLDALDSTVEGLMIRGHELTVIEFHALGIKQSDGTQAAATYLKEVHNWSLEDTRELLCCLGRHICKRM